MPWQMRRLANTPAANCQFYAPLYITDADDPRIDDGAGMPCFACNGRGFHRPSFTSPFSLKNVRNFAAFLRDCGGFAIL